MMNEQFENSLQEEMKTAASPSLTLNPDAPVRSINPFAAEPTLTTDTGMNSGSSVSAGSVDESMLTPQEQKQVEEFSSQINLRDVRQMNGYGAAAQKGIASFSVSITGKTQTRDFGEVGESLRELRTAIGSTTAPAKKGLLGLFQRGREKLTYLIANYETAETSIKKVEQDLNRHQQVLLRDVYIYDQMYDLNLQYYKEITMYIIAGKKALTRTKSAELPVLRARAEATNDQLQIQQLRDFEEICTRFEKRLHDLELSRLVCIQQAPQIRQLQNADQELADRLRADVLNTIPLWRNQMVLALGIEHNRRALDAQSAINEMTNEMFRRNSETLRQGAIDAARASESSVIDIDTLKKCNEDIIASINEVVKIHEEGSQRRSEAEAELAKLEQDLKTALMDAGSRI